MKKPLLIIFILLFSFVTKAQKIDTTIYYGCKIIGDTTTYVGLQGNSNRQATGCKSFSYPKFRGGDQKFHKFLVKNLKWPDKSGMIDVRGKVYLSLVVEKNGKLTNVTVIRGLDPVFDAEAVRVIKLSPKWIPAKKNGVPVRCHYTLPISFTITNE